MVEEALQLLASGFLDVGLELRGADFFACIFSAKGFHRLHEPVVA